MGAREGVGACSKESSPLGLLMDWNSEEGRNRLSKAWHKRCVEERGVLTVGGWQSCLDQFGTLRWLPPSGDKWLADRWQNPGEIAFDQALERGDLLPRPDPSDRATWSCLLADLAKANGYERRDSQVCCLVPIRSEQGQLWKLFSMGVYPYGGPEFTCLGVWGPYTKERSVDEALVYIRARIAKETGK